MVRARAIGIITAANIAPPSPGPAWRSTMPMTVKGRSVRWRLSPGGTPGSAVPGVAAAAKAKLMFLPTRLPGAPSLTRRANSRLSMHESSVSLGKNLPNEIC